MNWGLLGFAMCYSRKEVTSLPVSFNTVTIKMSGSSRYLLHCYWQWTVFVCTNVWMWMHRLNGGFCSDIDKVMINLKTEEFVLDGQPLQSLQQLIQWVGDFVLYLLVNLPNQVSSTGRHSPAVMVLSNLLLWLNIFAGLHRASRVWVPAGRCVSRHAQRDAGDDSYLGPVKTRLFAHLHGHIWQPGQHVFALPPAH